MADKTTDRKYAIFIPTGNGGKKLVGYRMILNGVLGIAYMREEKLMGFQPMDEFLRDFFKGRSSP